MRADIYVAMAQVEDRHWWFRARRAICRHVLDRANIPKGANILDAGSGTGGNLGMLSEYGTVFAMEMDEQARALASSRNIVKVEEGMLPHSIPFAPQQFDLAAMCDVLEHVDEDYETLVALGKRLNPGGRLLITVPAFQFLWSQHDTLHHHKRRYRLGALKALVERAGYKVTFASYINFWLFPLIAVMRLLDRLFGPKAADAKAEENAELTLPPAPVNAFLEKVFSSERLLLDRIGLPFGVSILLLAQKN